jgi:uncharacterized membrane protein YqaE (UPF0057 family)
VRCQDLRHVCWASLRAEPMSFVHKRCDSSLLALLHYSPNNLFFQIIPTQTTTTPNPIPLPQQQQPPQCLSPDRKSHTSQTASRLSQHAREAPIAAPTTPQYHKLTHHSSDIIKIICAVVLPPLGVFLERGCGADLLINLLLTILGCKYTRTAEPHTDLPISN